MKKIYNRLKDKGNLMKQAVDDTRLSIDLDFNQKRDFKNVG
ncbi:hypothetical protein AKUH1B105A_01050 [Apilactobacillus kunkeei]|nr:hypothetical protein AKUH1B105A_01050 [Apilactobacillus kunkeei]